MGDLAALHFVLTNFEKVPGLVDGADGHGAFGANGGHQAGGRGPEPLPLS